MCPGFFPTGIRLSSSAGLSADVIFLSHEARNVIPSREPVRFPQHPPDTGDISRLCSMAHEGEASVSRTLHFNALSAIHRGLT